MCYSKPWSHSPVWGSDVHVWVQQAGLVLADGNLSLQSGQKKTTIGTHTQYIYVSSLCTCTVPHSWKFSPISPPAHIDENIYLFSCVKDCIVDMATVTALTKILSLENYYNTKIHVAGLGENFIPRYVLAIQYYTDLACSRGEWISEIICHHVNVLLMSHNYT